MLQKLIIISRKYDNVQNLKNSKFTSQDRKSADFVSNNTRQLCNFVSKDNTCIGQDKAYLYCKVKISKLKTQSVPVHLELLHFTHRQLKICPLRNSIKYTTSLGNRHSLWIARYCLISNREGLGTSL